MIRYNPALLLIALGMLVIGYACQHTPPNTTPQAAVAHYGADVLKGVNDVRTVVIQATESRPPLLTIDQAAPVMNDLRRATDTAGELETALKAYDAATTNDAKAPIASRIEALLAAITSALNSSTSSTLPPQLVQQTASLVANVTSTIANVRAALALKGGQS